MVCSQFTKKNRQFERGVDSILLISTKRDIETCGYNTDNHQTPETATSVHSQNQHRKYLNQPKL